MKRIYLHKAKSQIARHHTIRDINRRIVLNYIRDLGPLSRADIARETALQRSSVSAIVDDLISDDLVDEIGTGNSTGGRKPTLLKLRTGIPVAIGVDITPGTTTIALADLTGQVLQKEEFPTSPDVKLMSEEIIRRIKKHAVKNKKHSLEVGISIPGVADNATGNVRYIPYFNWSNWDIARQIEGKTGLRVTVDNDANAIALAELWFGKETTRKARNFITVLVAEGVGTGIIFDGQVYRGDMGAAGEFGHMIIGENGPVQCSCGNRSCWEAHASEKAAICRYQNKNNGSSTGDTGGTIEQLLKLAKSGDKHAIEALKETAKYIGIGISNLIIGFSPQAVVVSGRITQAWDIFRGEIELMTERTTRQGIPQVSLFMSSLGDSPTLMGSLSLVLAQKFALSN
jgi:predicted NBD/HSP70 family sugar kinase